MATTGYTLILVWYAMSQSYMRPDKPYPQVVIHKFDRPSQCQQALATIKQMANGKSIEGTCI